jgi:CDP-diacylglycerol--serine O-phosphatidyltransferase
MVVIGKYNKSVILTYVGVLVSLIGMTLSINLLFSYAIICLIVAGICDLFDGKIARSCKRTDDEKNFGIQLDSLADVVSFVVYPVILGYSMGLFSIVHIAILGLYMLCGIMRLAWFNMITDINEPTKFYSGLPVTYSALIISSIYLLGYFIPYQWYYILLTASYLIMAALFILNIKIAKPRGIWYVVFGLLAVGMITTILIMG